MLPDRLTHLLILLALCALARPAPAAEPEPIYRDASAPLDARTDDLLRRMSLEEKVAQLLCLPNTYDIEKLMAGQRVEHAFDPARLADGMGQLAMLSYNAEKNRKPREHAELYNRVQRFFIEKSRLGIPVIIHEEALHGFNAVDATNFPSALALAATFDPDLVHRIFTQVGAEARSRGTSLVLSPNLDLGRDPRWGRTEETYGEDPYLASRMGVASITGLQGHDLDRIGPDRVAATAKHFTAHGQPQGGNNIAPPQADAETIRNVLNLTFEAAVREAGVRSVMASYNEIEGVPVHASKALLTTLLRERWGFNGIVVSDWYGIPIIGNIHRVAADDRAAAVLALHAGVDSDLPDFLSYQFLPELVRAGRVPEALVDRAARRVLRLKFALGLFDKPYVDPARAEALAGATEHRATAREAAGRGIVLLKNENSLLPLDPARLKTLAVIGPNADVAINGNYASEPRERISPLAGIRARLGERVRVLHHPGVILTRTLPKAEADLFVIDNPSEKDAVHLENPDINRARIPEAVAVARQADVVVLCLGTTKDMMREGWATYHKGDNASLRLRAQQIELIDAILATGKPVVALLFTGGPVTVEEFVDRVPALAQCWYLGQETGRGVADFLFGDIDASGRLPISIPRSEGQLPVYYNHKPTAKLRGYLFDETLPRFAFGQGMSYTTFTFANLRLDPEAPILSAASFADVRVLVDVTNTGGRVGVAVPQLYVRDEVASLTRPVKELKRFARVTLAPGETRTVALTITADKLAFINAAGERVVEPGEYTILVGSSSRDADLLRTTLVVPGDRAAVIAEPDRRLAAAGGVR